MNILMTSTAYPPSIGGAQLLHHELAIYLSKRNDVKVISLWDSVRSDWLMGTTVFAHGSSKFYDLDGVFVCRLGLSAYQKIGLIPLTLAFYPFMNQITPYIARVYAHALSENSSSIDIIHNVRIGRVPFSFASYQIAAKRNIPFVLTPVHHPRWTGWANRAWIDLYRKADGVIAMTRAEKKQLIQLGVKENKIYITGMGPILSQSFDSEDFRNKYGLENSPFILFLGQHRSYKGYRELLEASKYVWEKHPEVLFVFIGPAVGDSEKYFKNLDPRIRRLGSVDVQTKSNALAACTLLCLPSSQESFGGVYTEAWVLKKPVIGCNIPAVSEIISDGVDGYIVEQNPLDIAEKINEILRFPDNAERMGNAGHSKVMERYTWEKLGELTENAYYHILSSGS